MNFHLQYKIINLSVRLFTLKIQNSKNFCLQAQIINIIFNFSKVTHLFFILFFLYFFIQIFPRDFFMMETSIFI